MADSLGRIVIIGLDGCTLDVLKPWAEEGILPNFASLMQGSAWGRLMSTYPPLTMPAWVSFSTGKNPGRFGIYGFVSFLDGSYRLQPNTHFHARDQLEFWDILNANGYTCGIVNYPLMDRPVKLDGYCVPGFMANEIAYKTYPVELREELDREVGKYELDARGAYVMVEEEHLRSSLRVIDKRADAILYLLRERPVDVFVGIFTMTDRIQHRMYNKYGPGCYHTESPEQNPMSRFFQALDKRIGDIIAALDEDDLLLIISDHGFSHADRSFFINNWLLDKGLLKWKGKGLLSRLGITQKNIGRLVYKFGLYKQTQRLAPSFLKKTIPPGRNPSHKGINIVDSIYEDRIDWRRTKAVAIGSGPTAAVYLNTTDRPQGSIPPEDVDGLRDDIITMLRSEIDPDTGEELAINIRSAQELYVGDNPPNTADFYIDFEGDLLPAPSITDDGKLYGPHPIQSHAMDGIFFAKHPWIRPGNIDDRSLLDIMPTVLHLKGIALPQEIDGQVLLDIFHAGSEPRKRPVERGEGQTARDIKEREHIARIARKLRGETQT
jgi:predicted AlkP superfamily phosphohydrolase/phosphomutase